MKKKKSIPIIIIVVAVAVVAIAGALFAFFALRGNEETILDIDIPYISRFACDYYDENGEVIDDKSKVFNHGDEIRVKIGFTLSSEAFAAGKRNFTLKFAPTDGFDGKILSANSSATSNKDFTAVYTVDDKKNKKCEVELQINVYFSAGYIEIGYAYDDEDYLEVRELPLNNDSILLYTYDAATDGYTVSKDEKTGEWFNNADKISLPDSFAGKPVTKIHEGLFKNCVNLKTIEIPEGITDVDSGIFSECENLQYNEYGNACYLGNEDNPYIALVKPVSTEVTNVSINKSTKVICGGAFKDCVGLKRVSLPDSVTEIGKEAFWGCSGLTSVSIPDSITIVGKDAFSGCESLAYNEFEDALYLGNEQNPFAVFMKLNVFYLESVNINEGTKVISDYALSSKGMSAVTIPDSVTNIGVYAFGSCTSLTSITIPNSVTKIGYQTFYDCRGLTSVTIPNSVTYIGSGAFTNCESLTEITIPDSVKYIDDYAFSSCSAVTNITISNGITRIGSGTFSGCGSLTSITIPDGVTEIGGDAFSGCSSLTSITIPKGVTNIGYTTFKNCSSLTSVTLSENLTIIGEEAFSGCSGLTSITIPAKVEEIGKRAFYGCGLTSITIPANARSIGVEAFNSCLGLTDITIMPDWAFDIGIRAFGNCPRIENVVFAGMKDKCELIFSGQGKASDDGNVTIKCTDGELKFTFYNW